jgi:acylphosphatase
MDLISKRILLSGRVQGVGFRHFTRVTARDLNVKGWVKNRSDGDVEVVVQGEKSKVNTMIERLKQGPVSARVDRIDVTDNETEKTFSVFDIRR